MPAMKAMKATKAMKAMKAKGKAMKAKVKAKAKAEVKAMKAMKAITKAMKVPKGEPPTCQLIDWQAGVMVPADVMATTEVIGLTLWPRCRFIG